MPYIKNIEHEKVMPLIGEICVQRGQIVSKTLAQNEAPHAVYALEDFKWILTVVFPPII